MRANQAQKSFARASGFYFQQAVSSTFAIFGVRGFITAFLFSGFDLILNDHEIHSVVQKVRDQLGQIQKGKRQSIAALQMAWQKSRLSDRQEMIYPNTPTRSVNEGEVDRRPRSHFGLVRVRQLFPLAVTDWPSH